MATLNAFQILSDLHLEIERVGAPLGKEFYYYEIQPAAPHLVLLGDIGWTVQDGLFAWFEQQLSRFQIVFFVPGNHEPYRTSIDDSLSRLEVFAAKYSVPGASFGRFVLLNRTRYDISPTLTLLGCTLWSRLDMHNIDILSWSVIDFARIEGWTPELRSVEHHRDLQWLNTTVSDISRDEPHRKVIILTHHAPAVEGTSAPQYVGGPTSSAFATELSGEPCWNANAVTLWAFGHTHFNCDFVRNGVRLYTNQRGYKDGERCFDASKIVRL